MKQKTVEISFDPQLAASFLDIMSNPVRLRILICVSRSERDVSSLASETGVSQSALSQHLAKLRSAKVVATRREKQQIYYKLSESKVMPVLWMLESLFAER